MAELQGEKLIEYLKDAISLESDIATQEATCNQYNAEMEERKPEFHAVSENKLPDAPMLENVNGEHVGSYLFCAAVCIIGGLFFVGSGIEGWAVWGILFIIAGILCILGSVLHVRNVNQRNESRQSAYNQKVNNVKAKNKDIQKQNAGAHETFQQRFREWEECSSETNQVMDARKDDTSSVLSRLYDLDVIYPKYRNLPALTSICEYLITGRCDSLTGPHGAYNLYEDEVRKNTVISQLNTVIENLESIKNNQYMLYQQVKQIQHNSSQMLTDMQELKGYAITMTQLTALSAYYTALNERNNRITMLYHL